MSAQIFSVMTTVKKGTKEEAYITPIRSLHGKRKQPIPAAKKKVGIKGWNSRRLLNKRLPIPLKMGIQPDSN